KYKFPLCDRNMQVKILIYLLLLFLLNPSENINMALSVFINTYIFCNHLGQLLYNLALKQKAVQSSTSGTVGIAGKAVDGNRDTNYQSGSCTLTNAESDPWWRVDLVNVYTIRTVMITNRQDLENGLDGAEIWIGNSTTNSDPESIRNSILFFILILFLFESFYFPCNSMKGRYVTVFLPGSAKILSLCEVETVTPAPVGA
uniref:Fucolectin tachylectin-4 pentraxin-1 domain-containing protein n=1 Tax=Neolamprologus brichardi TaxID=32507 RepID=A0A3Q4MIW7_NEOBR